jgi:trigger factor
MGAEVVVAAGAGLDWAVGALPKVQAPSIEDLQVSIEAPPSPSAQELIDRLRTRLRTHAPRRQRAEYERIEPGDRVVCDLIVLCAGKVVAGGVHPSLVIDILPGHDLEGLALELVGHGPGARVMVESTGDLRWIVDVREVWQVERWELDDPLALASAGLGDNLEEAMDRLASEIDAEQGEVLLTLASQAVLAELGRRVSVSLPSWAIDEELARCWEKTQEPLLLEMELPDRLCERSLQDFMADPQLRNQAKERLRINLGLAALAREHQLVPTKSAIVDWLEPLARDLEVQPADMLNDELARSAAAELALHLSVVEWVMARAQVEVIEP